MEDIGYDAFAAGPGAASSGPAEQWSPEDAPDLSNARKQVYADERHKRPSSTGAEPDPVAVPATQSMVSPGAARGAGFGIIWAAAGAGVGAATLGGWWGAGAGLLIAGAIRNGARARRLWGSGNPGDREEAGTSATMAVLGGGAGAYLGYRAYNRDNEPE